MVTQAKTSLWHHEVAKIWSAHFQTGFYINGSGQKERESFLHRGHTCWCRRHMKKWILHNGDLLSFPTPPSHLDPHVFLCTQVYGDSSRARAMSRAMHGETEMSDQSRKRLLNGSRRLAEVFRLPKCSLSPQICLSAGDTQPPEAHAMTSGYGNIRMRRTCHEHGGATAGFSLPCW